MKYFFRTIAAGLFLLVCIHWVYALEVPDHPEGRVTDFTNTLTKNNKDFLNKKLGDFENRTTNQIAVLIIPSLEGQSLEDYSIRLADTWEIGHKDKDNGVILLIVKHDKTMRIEAGYGLEAVLPDSRAGSIIRDDIAPHFQKGDFFKGVNQGIDAIMQSIDPGGRQPVSKKITGEMIIAGVTVLFFIIVFGYIILVAFSGNGSGRSGSRYHHGGGSRYMGGGYSGGGTGGGFSGRGGGFGGGGASGGW